MGLKSGFVCELFLFLIEGDKGITTKLQGCGDVHSVETSVAK